MTFNFETDRDAYLAVLALVTGADQAGSLRERDFLFNQVRALPVFGSPTDAEFGKLLGQVTDVVYTALPQQDGAVTAEGTSSLLAAVRATLSPELRAELVGTVEELCAADGTCDTEAVLIGQIRDALVGG
jgi:hypothetical protein